MAHTIEEKKKLLNRVRRIMGQVAAIERSLDQEKVDCSETRAPFGHHILQITQPQAGAQVAVAVALTRLVPNSDSRLILSIRHAQDLR